MCAISYIGDTVLKIFPNRNRKTDFFFFGQVKALIKRPFEAMEKCTRILNAIWFEKRKFISSMRTKEITTLSRQIYWLRAYRSIRNETRNMGIIHIGLHRSMFGILFLF